MNKLSVFLKMLFLGIASLASSIPLFYFGVVLIGGPNEVMADIGVIMCVFSCVLIGVATVAFKALYK